MVNTYFLPTETSALIEKHMPHCKNLGLILDKYIPQELLEDTKERGPKKALWLKNLAQGQFLDLGMLQAVNLRWQAFLNKYHTTQFSAALAWRMVVGLGSGSVLETDMTLHHVYGVPFIPGSALKGLTRSYAASEDENYFIEIDGKSVPSPEPEKDHETLQRIFGSQEHAGTVLFFDALPESSNVNFVVDIMNPHYPDYYNSLKNNTKPPTNDQSPNPITFLTVAEMRFTFALAPRNSAEKEHLKDVELATAWLKMALQKYGVGGKTSAGYGYFTLDKSANEPPQIVANAQHSVSIQQSIASELPWQRPSIGNFSTDQSLPDCFVIEPSAEMRQFSPEAKVFLRYRENPSKYVFVVIEEEIPDVETWTPKQQKNCLFQREERRGDSLVLICKPKPKSEKKSQKGSKSQRGEKYDDDGCLDRRTTTTKFSSGAALSF